MKKNIWKFVVRDTFKITSYDKYCHHKKTEKRNLGGVSVQVRSLIKCLSFNVSRSDRPSLFNSNFNVMRDTKRHGSTASVRESIPTQLAKALRLIGEARGIICHIDEANPHLKDDIYETVFKTDQLLVESAFGISDMLGVAYREEHFFGKEVAL